MLGARHVTRLSEGDDGDTSAGYGQRHQANDSAFDASDDSNDESGRRLNCHETDADHSVDWNAAGMVTSVKD